MTSSPPISRSAPMLLAAIAVALIALSSLFFLVRTADAQEAPDVTGSISGRVVNEDGQAPTGIEVSLYWFRGDYWSEMYSRYADESGAYRFDYLATGTYRLEFTDRNGVYHQVSYPDAKYIEVADDIPVAGQHVTGLETVMRIGGKIKGTVRLWNNEVPDEIYVYLYQKVGEEWIQADRDYDPNVSFQTEIPYQFSGLSPGEYHVKFSVSYVSDSGIKYVEEFYDNALDHSDATAVNVIVDETTAAIDAVLGENSTMASVSGEVVSPVGAALPDIRVTAYISEGDRWSRLTRTYSDDEGRYTLQALMPSTYTLSFEDEEDEYAFAYLGGVGGPELAESIALTRSQQLMLPNFVMTPTGMITGSVTFLDGSVPSSVRVDVYSERTSFTEIESTYAIYGDDELPDFELRGLVPGTYRLFFSGSDLSGTYSEYYLDALSIDDAVDIVVAPRNVVSNVNVMLGEHPIYSSISGSMTTANGQPPVEPIYVEALYYHSEDDDRGYWRTMRAVYSDDQGYYHIPGLIPDTYLVHFETDSDPSFVDPVYHEQYYDGADDTYTAERIVLGEGEDRTGVDAVLHSDGIITGTIRLFHRRPFVNSVSLTLYSQRGEEWESVEWQNAAGYDDVNDYVWGSLPAGTYRMAARDGYGETRYYPDADTIEEAEDIEVALDTVTPGIDFTFDEDLADARIEGTVTFDGVAQEGMHVELYIYHRPGFQRDWWRLVYAVTDVEGRYVIDGLEARDYRICVVDPSGTIAKACYRNASGVDDAATLRLADGEVIDDLPLEMTIIAPSYDIFLPIMPK